MKRSPLRRSTTIARTEVKPKTCTAPKCGREFYPVRPLQNVCGPVCARKKAEADRKGEETARRQALETIPQLIAKAQKEFNAYIRERDKQAGHRCISSGRALDWSGNGVDAGHYRSVGAAPHLRFDERNCHAQSKHDNQYRAGNAVDYRIGLIQRIGLGQIEALEADNRIHHWTHDELRSIAAEYRAKTRALKKKALRNNSWKLT